MGEKETRKLVPTRKSPLAIITEATLGAEKTWVRGTVREAHLRRRGLTCPYTVQLVERITPFRSWTREILAELIKQHPTFWWHSHAKGIGLENISKLVGDIENFGRYYPVGDPQIPVEVIREPEEYIELDEANKEHIKMGVWVEGIERLLTPSKQRVLLGHAPGMEGRRGEKHSYDAVGKMLLWRVGTSLIKVSDGSYADFYHLYKAYLVDRSGRNGIIIVPTPKERFCPACQKEVVKKAARYCPDCKGPLSLKEEPAGYLYLGHLDLMARRRMQQLFSDHLNVIWRKTLKLSVREIPYPVEFLGHSSVITPFDMLDKSCGKKDCSICHGEPMVSKFQLRYKEGISRAVEILEELKEHFKVKEE